jgi:deoxyribodipyrimidine photo-lyase
MTGPTPVVASFPVKPPKMEWREGEAGFWDMLVDQDLAKILAGWQWVPGCGGNAAPSPRTFDPVLQGERFDPGGDHVRCLAPELARLPNACIHRPWRGEDRVAAGAGVRLGAFYSAPIDEHATARVVLKTRDRSI